MPETIDHEKVIEECERAEILLENIRQAARQKAERASREERLPESKLPRRMTFQFPTKLVGLALVATALVMLVPALLRLRRELPPPPLTAADFKFVEETMGRVMTRPPHVYVTMEVSRWRELSGAEQQRLVENVGRTASGTGYVGAHFLTTDGRLVAQWRREGGVQLFQKR